MIYTLICTLAKIILVVFFRMEVQGLNHLPQQGPVIVVANHVSYLDPIAVAAALNRKVHFMAKEELFHIPILGWVIRHLNAFPVKRGVADRGAIKMGLDILKQGNVLGIFPEGGRVDDPRVEEAKQGAAFMAAKTGTPVVPMALIGTSKVLPKGVRVPRLQKVKVVIGQPIQLETGEGINRKQAINEFSQRIMDEVVLLGAQYY